MTGGAGTARSRWTRLESLLNEGTSRRLGRTRRAASARWGLASLPRIAMAYGTDKWGGHRYAYHYGQHFRHLRFRSFVLLEIGVGGYEDPRSGGESLRMWKTFFPRASIVGVDVEDKHGVDEPRIRVLKADQSVPEALRRVVAEVGRPTVVIDDGSHVPDHVRTSFETLFPLLVDGGFYCVEDLQTSYWPSWGGSLDRHARHTSVAMVKELVDGLNYEEFIDADYQPSYLDTHVVAVHAYHNLVVIEKGHNVEGTDKAAYAGIGHQQGLTESAERIRKVREARFQLTRP